MLRSLACLAFVALMGAPASAQDAADFVVRLNRVEGQMRQMSGQIEQLQFENKQLKEQVRKFQEDVEFRFQEGRGGVRAQPSAQPSAGQTPGSPAAPTRAPGKRGDAFDPNASPSAPGAPRPLGTTPPSAPLASASASASAAASTPASNAPVPPAGVASGSSIASIIEDEESLPPGAGGPLDLNQLGRTGSTPPVAPPPTPSRAAPSVAAAGSGDPRADYDAAYAYLLQKQYEQAEMGFRGFLQAHPRDRLASDATFWLGESYQQRNRHREAAEQFLKVSTEYARSAKAADAMLKLGVSLHALGARDQACATFAELERKYPQALPSLRQGVEREKSRARCAA